MKPPGMTVPAPLNVMTHDSDFSCGEWRNHPSFAPNERVTTNGTNTLESILKSFMQETKLQFQAQKESIKIWRLKLVKFLLL